VEQLQRAIRKLGLRGVAVGTAVGEDEFSNPRFHPFWAKCEELGILVFIHPAARTPDLKRRFQGAGWAQNVIGNPLDTSIAVWHLVVDGTLDHFPGLKILLAHGGGYIVSYAPRWDRYETIEPERYHKVPLRKKPSEYLKDMYCDSLVFTAEALRHLATVVGSDKVMLGTDHPIPWQPDAVDHILSTPTLTDDERIAMLGETAAKLLGLPARR
jgi:aminocarboxymuconate-semialdehyde decarboxylase